MIKRKPSPIFLGYGAKVFSPIPEAVPPAPVEVCSLSGCRARWGEGWLEHPFEPPALNRAHLVEGERQAVARSKGAAARGLRIYAYDAIPLIFGKDEPKEVSPEELLQSLDYLAPLPPRPQELDFEPLGYDIVQYPEGSNWGCSPLSCNGFFPQGVKANRYFLMDRFEDALTIARAAGLEEPEPGAYLIVGVFRRRESA